MFVFKQEKIEIQGHFFSIKELSAQGASQYQIELTKSKESEDDYRPHAVVIKFGCLECSEMSIDEILNAMPATVLVELSFAISNLSLGDIDDGEEGDEEKKT